ncbi:MAG TPA: hypothetical protein VF265_03940 [Nevskiaceae bacterium]
MPETTDATVFPAWFADGCEESVERALALAQVNATAFRDFGSCSLEAVQAFGDACVASFHVSSAPRGPAQLMEQLGAAGREAARQAARYVERLHEIARETGKGYAGVLRGAAGSGRGATG